jgi:hypothetical protein
VKNWLKYLLVGVVSATPTILFGQPDTLWTHYYNNGGIENGREECFRTIQTIDGGYLIGGRKKSPGVDPRQLFDDFYLVKTDSIGIEEWWRGYRITPRPATVIFMPQVLRITTVLPAF